ncbi:MAG: hypothetical protein AAF598_11880 [Bacteroidota bacterium]
MYRKGYLLVGVLLICCMGLRAQDAPTQGSSGFTATLFNFTYGFHFPGGDLSDRYGTASTVGFSPEFVYKRWIVGAEGNILFGGDVKVDVLANLRTPEGFIIGSDNAVTEVPLFQRGLYFGLNAGRLFPINGSRSGFKATIGGGFLQHKIRIQDDGGTALAVAGDLKKGYDRLTNGFALKQFVGYHFFSENRLINFFAGFEFYQGFTQSRRAINFDTMQADTDTRTDLMMGFKVGWTIPIFHYDPDKDFY